MKKKIFYISIETIKRSNFNNLQINQLVNLEKSLIYGQKISGHFIQGHVDTTAKVEVLLIDKSWLLKLKIKNMNYKYLEEKGFYLNQWSFVNYFEDL